MVPEAHIFNISGPAYLNSVDWNNGNHRRCVLASLVQGVYVHEHDRRMNRTGPKSLASQWWHFFHFHLVETLHDTSDHSVIGAVLQFTTSKSSNNNNNNNIKIKNSPKYVIAFRGIITDTPATPPLYKDILLCLRSFLGTLHNSTRFRRALAGVQHWVAGSGAGKNVWLTGHSLGSAIALLAAKNMAMLGYRPPTFLFNPPFPSAILENTVTGRPKLQQGIHIASSVVKTGVSVYLQSKKTKQNLKEGEKEEEDKFSALCDWVPCLFVNPGDTICSGYIGYFEQRLKMNQIGGEALEHVAMKCTIESFIMCNVFDLKSEPHHLIPSAELIINQAKSPSFKMAHGIQQWWDLNLPSHHVLYHYK